MNCKECDLPVFAGGLCSKHYWRVRRHGSVNRVRQPNAEICVHEGCENRAHAKSLCSKHYQQALGPLRSLWRNLRSKAPGDYPPAWDSYECFIEAIGSPPGPDHQLRRPNQTAPWGPGNMVWREPIGVSSKDERARYAWRWHIRNRYDLTEDDIAEMVAAQDSDCPVCAQPLDGVDKDGKPLKVCVDHVHASDIPKRDTVRGIIHDNCNKGLGLIGDDLAGALRAVAYLQAYERKRNPS